ncbi:hypothetical protein VTO73DRAFT_11362 [Trametes versicolor]
MKAIRGVLLTCDSAVKQILLTLNEKENFIIEDLDDFHVVIKADEEYRVRRELEAELEKNTYSLDSAHHIKLQWAQSLPDIPQALAMLASPILWDIFLAGFHLAPHDDDIFIGDRRISHLEFADDIALLSLSAAGIQSKLD